MESIPLIVLLIVLVFFVLIGIHEWGHFYFAKRAGILVREFSIGFGPKLFSFRRGETTFHIALLPIGGYVQMAGEESEPDDLIIGQSVYLKIHDQQVTHIYTSAPEQQLVDDQDNPYVSGILKRYDLLDSLQIELESQETFQVAKDAHLVHQKKSMQIAPRDRQFASKTVGQRAMAIFAGPLMNAILAFLLFMSVVFMIGVPKDPPMIQLEDVLVGSPASNAGLQKGDIVFSINNFELNGDFEKLSELIANNTNRKMNWTVLRDGERYTYSVMPKVSEDGQTRVGISLGYERRNANIGEALSGAWNYTTFFTEAILNGFKRLVMGQVKIEELGGPVRTVTVTYEAARDGFPKLVYWAAILSLYLAIFNLLPFPALDGSRLLFLAIEWIRGRPMEARKENIVHLIGFATLMGLMLVVTYFDIARLFK